MGLGITASFVLSMLKKKKKKKKKNTIRTDRPTPGILALFGDSRASLSHIVPWDDHTGGRS